jgi:hypothetical protein
MLEEAEMICRSNSTSEGTKAMRKNSAVERVPLSCNVNLRSFGKKDAGVEGQDSISKLRHSVSRLVEL